MVSSERLRTGVSVWKSSPASRPESRENKWDELREGQNIGPREGGTKSYALLPLE